MQRDLVTSANEASNPKNIGLTSFNEDAISLDDVQNNKNNQNVDSPPPEDTKKTEDKKTEDKDTENEKQTEEVKQSWSLVRGRCTFRRKK